MLDPDADQRGLHELADETAVLQAKLNLRIGWATIIDRPVPAELYDANAKLVEVARELREVARQALEDEVFQQGVHQAELAARKTAVNER